MAPRTKAKETLITRSIGRFYRNRKSEPSSESSKLVWENQESGVELSIVESPVLEDTRPQQEVVSVRVPEPCIELHTEAIVPSSPLSEPECSDAVLSNPFASLLAEFDAAMCTEVVSQRAFEIWLRNGKKHGQDAKQWEQARGELLSEFIASHRE